MNQGKADRTYSIAEITQSFIAGCQFGAEMMRAAAKQGKEFTPGEIEALTAERVKTLLELLNQEEPKR